MIRYAFASAIVLTLSACGAGSPDASGLRDDHGGNAAAYPTHPDLTITPGATCQVADELRYPEHIKYCSRSVNSGLKKDIISQYDHDFGFTIEAMSRGDFKIDHFIPLCMGGANARTNLWPQHKSVYVKTDGIEMKLCQLLSFGTIKQANAIEQIRHVKFNLNEAQAFEASLDQQIATHQHN